MIYCTIVKTSMQFISLGPGLGQTGCPANILSYFHCGFLTSLKQ